MRLPLPPNSSSLLDRYRLLTLALASAIEQDHWTEIDGIVASRESVLRQLESETKPCADGHLQEAIHADAVAMNLLRSKLGEVTSSIRGIGQAKLASQEYRPRVAAVGLDQAS